MHLYIYVWTVERSFSRLYSTFQFILPTVIWRWSCGTELR